MEVPLSKIPARVVHTRTVKTSECNRACWKEKQDYAAR